MTQDLDIAHLRGWIGSKTSSEELVSIRTARSLSSILELDLRFAPGAKTPLGIHWCIAPEVIPTSHLKADGHAARSELLPPVPLEKRMWASGELVFSGEILVGDVVKKESEVVDVSLKEGQSGRLCFVKVSHTYTTPRGTAISEVQNIVYRDATAGASPRLLDAIADPELDMVVPTSSALLFRFSAITFNSHRIHYDHPFSTDVEGYSGLVVHGPLQATVLLNALADAAGFPLRSFRYRGVQPLIEQGSFRVLAKRSAEGFHAQVLSPDGVVTMDATAQV